MRALDLTQYDEAGLYLEMESGDRVVLTRARINERTQAVLDDPGILPPEVRAAADYKPCDICPERDTATICHAITVTLPFIDEIDRYMSYDRVTAVYRDEEDGCLIVRDTSLQSALQYVSILSLMHYCEVGRTYLPYFRGINPLMAEVKIAEVVFRNMYASARGDVYALANTLTTMQRELMHTTECQVKRLRLISKKDAFLNAFIGTQSTTELILLELQALVTNAST